MNDYKGILVLHAVDDSTLFLIIFEKEFGNYYFSFDSTEKSISETKILLGNLEPKSLVVYLGHGSSSGLYEPDDKHIYEKLFLDVKLGNYYLENHDVLLLSCRSNDYLNKIHTPNCSL